MTGKLLCWSGVVFCVLLTAGQSAWAQHRGMHQMRSPVVTYGSIPVRENTLGESMNQRMLKESYKQLQKEVQHLDELANQLKKEVMTQDNEDILSLSGVKKAKQIEKLAKKIQGRMKNL